MVTPSNHRSSLPGTYEAILLQQPACRHKYDLVGHTSSDYHRLQHNNLKPGVCLSLHINIGPQVSNPASETTDIAAMDIERGVTRPKIDIYQSDMSLNTNSSSEDSNHHEVHHLSDPDITLSESLYDRLHQCSSSNTKQQDHTNVDGYSQLDGHRKTSVTVPTPATISHSQNHQHSPQTEVGDYSCLEPKSQDSTSLTEFEALYMFPTVPGVKHPKIVEKTTSNTEHHYHVLEGPGTQDGADSLGGSDSNTTDKPLHNGACRVPLKQSKDNGYSCLEHTKLTAENGFDADENYFEMLYEKQPIAAASSYPATAAVHVTNLHSLRTTKSYPEGIPKPPPRTVKSQDEGYDHLEPQDLKHKYTAIIRSCRNKPSQHLYAQPIVSTPDMYISEKGHVYHVLDTSSENK